MKKKSVSPSVADRPIKPAMMPVRDASESLSQNRESLRVVPIGTSAVRLRFKDVDLACPREDVG